MIAFHLKFVLLSVAFLAGADRLSTQALPKADDLWGTWQLVSSKDLQTGVVTQNTNTSWILFTKSHWTVLVMEPGRKVITSAEFEKLSADEQAKANYALLWNEKNEQIFQARGGSYRLEGDKLYHTATIAIQTGILGIDRVLKVMQLDKTAFVAQTEFPDAPNLKKELTYRRLD
jgi:hypothetical protein